MAAVAATALSARLGMGRVTRQLRGFATGRTLHLPTGEWLRVEAASERAEGATDGISSDEVVVRVGVSEENLDSLGDIQRVEVVANVGCRVGTAPDNNVLLRLHWEGFLITAADELYHTRWANATGTHSLQLPFAARVVEYNTPVLEDPAKQLTAEDDSWLVRVCASSKAVLAGCLAEGPGPLA